MLELDVLRLGVLRPEVLLNGLELTRLELDKLELDKLELEDAACPFAPGVPPVPADRLFVGSWLGSRRAVCPLLPPSSCTTAGLAGVKGAGEAAPFAAAGPERCKPGGVSRVTGEAAADGLVTFPSGDVAPFGDAAGETKPAGKADGIEPAEVAVAATAAAAGIAGEEGLEI